MSDWRALADGFETYFDRVTDHLTRFLSHGDHFASPVIPVSPHPTVATPMTAYPGAEFPFVELTSDAVAG